jgi:hypothetical protein
LTPLAETLGLSLSRGFLHFTARKLRVFEIWPQVVGPENAARVRASLIHNGRLTVLVPGPAWLDRFSYQKADWLRRLNLELAGQPVVEDIILKIGDFPAEPGGRP